MPSRTWQVCQAILTFTALGFCVWFFMERTYLPAPIPVAQSPPTKVTLQIDHAVRGFLNLTSLDGQYEMPEGENYGVISLLVFENGEFRDRRLIWQITGSPQGVRTVSYQFVWGKGVDGTVHGIAVIGSSCGLMTTGMPEKHDDLYEKLNGPGLNSMIGSPNETVRGFKVLGFRASERTRPGKAEFAGQLKGIDFMLDTRQTVVVVGVKTCSTFQQMSDWMSVREPADPK